MRATPLLALALSSFLALGCTSAGAQDADPPAPRTDEPTDRDPLAVHRERVQAAREVLDAVRHELWADRKDLTSTQEGLKRQLDEIAESLEEQGDGEEWGVPRAGRGIQRAHQVLAERLHETRRLGEHLWQLEHQIVEVRRVLAAAEAGGEEAKAAELRTRGEELRAQLEEIRGRADPGFEAAMGRAIHQLEEARARLDLPQPGPGRGRRGGPGGGPGPDLADVSEELRGLGGGPGPWQRPGPAAGSTQERLERLEHAVRELHEMLGRHGYGPGDRERAERALREHRGGGPGGMRGPGPGGGPDGIRGRGPGGGRGPGRGPGPDGPPRLRADFDDGAGPRPPVARVPDVNREMDDMRRRIDELRVHAEELQRQNEALRRELEELRRDR